MTPPERSAAVAAAARILATARAERDQAAALGGLEAVAAAAWFPGHPAGSPEAITAKYGQLQRQARQRAGAA